jgi:hypothetical protein
VWVERTNLKLCLHEFILSLNIIAELYEFFPIEEGNLFLHLPGEGYSWNLENDT